MKRKSLLSEVTSSLSKLREHPVVLWPDICDNLGQVLVIICQLFVKIYDLLVIVTHI